MGFIKMNLRSGHFILVLFSLKGRQKCGSFEVDKPAKNPSNTRQFQFNLYNAKIREDFQGFPLIDLNRISKNYESIENKPSEGNQQGEFTSDTEPIIKRNDYQK
jgi:hypothetical protein